jgi:hypothetical protein
MYTSCFKLLHIVGATAIILIQYVYFCQANTMENNYNNCLLHTSSRLLHGKVTIKVKDNNNIGGGSLSNSTIFIMK